MYFGRYRIYVKKIREFWKTLLTLILQPNFWIWFLNLPVSVLDPDVFILKIRIGVLKNFQIQFLIKKWKIILIIFEIEGTTLFNYGT